MSKTYKLEDLKIYQFSEPTITVEELSLPNTESNDENAIAKHYVSTHGAMSKMYAYIPYIKLNNVYEISPLNITNFSLNCNGFVPEISFTVCDVNNDLKSKYYPRDGTIINLYIGTIGDEKTYKSTRLDFIITSLTPYGSVYGTANTGDSMIYGISGTLYVPELMYTHNRFESGTSFDAMQSIAGDLKLGFASNIEQTNDKQVWLNSYAKLSDFIKTIAGHAYVDDESFFAAFVDNYYNLNFVEVNRLFYQGGGDDRCVVYNTAHFEDDNPELTYEKDSAANGENGDDSWEGLQKEYDYELTNSKLVSGWSLYFDKYRVVTNGSGTLYNGYAKYVQWWDAQNGEFKSEPVVAYCYETPGLMPLNRGRLKNGQTTELTENLKSFAYGGMVGEDMNKNYKYAEASNELNRLDIEKFGLVVELPCVNPAIVRYSRIRVSVFEQNELNMESLIDSKDTNENGSITTDNGGVVPLTVVPELQNDVTPRFDITTEEGRNEAKGVGIYSGLQYPVLTDTAGTHYTKSGEILNESLSGYYVVTGYEVYMDGNQGATLRQRVYLSRKEYKPALKSDYTKNKSK